MSSCFQSQAFVQTTDNRTNRECLSISESLRARFILMGHQRFCAGAPKKESTNYINSYNLYKFQ